MLTDITHDGKSWVFQMGKCTYRCDDYLSLAEIKNELIKEQFIAASEYKKKLQELKQKDGKCVK